MRRNIRKRTVLNKEVNWEMLENNKGPRKFIEYIGPGDNNGLGLV